MNNAQAQAVANANNAPVVVLARNDDGTYSNMLAAHCDGVFAELVEQGIATGDWGQAAYYLVRHGEHSHYPLPLLFVSAEQREAAALEAGKPAPTQKWVNRARSKVLRALFV